MEFGFIDDGSSTTTDTETCDTHAETVLSEGVFETWLENGCQIREITPEVSPVIQVVPAIIRKYHKPPSRDRVSVSSLNTVIFFVGAEDDEDDESILMPFIGDNEFDGEFPAHIITVENEKMIAMSNPETLSILPTVQEAPWRTHLQNQSIGGTDCSKCSTKSSRAPMCVANITPSHSRSPSSHAFPQEQCGDEILTDTEVLTDTEELMSDRDVSSVSWTEEDDVDITEITETQQEDSEINSYWKEYLEDKEKRKAETSSNLKRAPNRDLVPPVHNTDMRVPTHRIAFSRYVDYQPSLTPVNGSVSFSRERAIEEDLHSLYAPPQPHGEMTKSESFGGGSFPQVVPHFDDHVKHRHQSPHPHPMDVYFEQYQTQARTPSDRSPSLTPMDIYRSPSLTPMDKLLESLPPLPSKKASRDSFHAVPTMYSPHLFKTPPLTPALPNGTKKASSEPKFIPSPANSFPNENSNVNNNSSSLSSNILLCKVEPEKKVAFSMKFSAFAVQNRHEEMKKKTHDRTISDHDFSDILSDDLLSDFEKGPSHEVRSAIPFLTMLVNEQQDIRIRVIE